MGGPPLLRLQAFGKRYANGKGVGPVTLDLEPGIHGLVGPNGSGKTTLIKTVLGFLTPTAGHGEVLGFDVSRDVREVRRHVGYMPENDVFVPGLNAAQTVRLAAELCGIPTARAHEAAAEALHAVALGEEALHAPNRLSTGQRQKMKLASALVHAPRLLILDEPTNGLDPRSRRTMLELITEVAQEKGMSVLLSTHILPDVQSVCRSAVVLRDGRLVAVEKVAERTVAPAGRKAWFDVDVLGDVAAFVQECRKARLEVRTDGSSVHVSAANAAAVQECARRSGAVLARLVPGTVGVEEAILQHLEAN